VVGTSLHKAGKISIVIESKDLLTNISESYILIEGQLTKEDGTVYDDADNVALTHNGIMQLFHLLFFLLLSSHLCRKASWNTMAEQCKLDGLRDICVLLLQTSDTPSSHLFLGLP
jgi:hypothetical protein